jgi:hypothetical protein
MDCSAILQLLIKTNGSIKITRQSCCGNGNAAYQNVTVNHHRIYMAEQMMQVTAIRRGRLLTVKECSRPTLKTMTSFQYTYLLYREIQISKYLQGINEFANRT